MVPSNYTVPLRASPAPLLLCPGLVGLEVFIAQGRFFFCFVFFFPRGADVSPSRCATDHNSDNTTAMLREWLVAVGRDYHSVVWKEAEGPR